MAADESMVELKHESVSDDEEMPMGVVKHEDMTDEDPKLADVIKRVHRNKGDMSLVFDMLQDHTANWLPNTAITPDVREKLRTVQVVTRKEEESFLRSKVAANGERDCARGDDCEGTRVVGPPGGVVLVEHWLPTSPRPEEPGLCIMCKRALVTYFYVNAIAEGENMELLYHSHANLVDVDGEYALDQCVVAGVRETHGALLPCALHCRAWYTYQGSKDGVHWFGQPGYRYPQVFRQLAAAELPS